MDEIERNGEGPDAVELTRLLEKILENPYEYVSHVAYITMLQKHGHSEDLRDARLTLHSFYPLSEGISFPVPIV